MSREASFREPVPLERRLKEPAATPERKFDPWSNRWSYRNSEAYPTNTTGYGAMSTPQERLTKTSRGAYGGMPMPKEVDEDDEDLKTLQKILKRRPELRAFANAPVEAARSPEHAALLRELDGLYQDLGQLPMGVHEAQYHDSLSELAEVFLGPLPEDSHHGGPPSALQKAAGRGAFGLGRAEMIRRGLLPARDGWA
jgi:hypothetical protein